MVLLRWLGKHYALALGIAAGVALGGAATVFILYDKPGRRLVEKTYEVLGLRTNVADYFAFGYGKPVEEVFEAVKSPTVPEWNVRRGLDIEVVAEGLDYPVNMEFVPEPGDDPDSPVFYFNELHGKIKYVGRDGKVYVYTDGLMNFPPIPVPKSDEIGVSGLLLAPESEDLFVTVAYKDESSGLLSNHVLRLVSEPGGKKMAKSEVILDLKQFTSPSNQIQQVVFGPDSKLYVSVGDAENHRLSLDLDQFGGKVIRMELDGSACEDNPYYQDATPDAPRGYVWASGIRNAFDIDFDPETGRLYGVDNGKNIDRFFEIARGGVYGWDGNPESIRINSLFTWGPIGNTAPTGIHFLREPVLGPGSAGRCYVACYGPAAEAGTNTAKSVLELTLDPETGTLTRIPSRILQYAGDAKATVLGLAEGPDGLYVTDFWGETTGFDDAKGRILKIVPSKATLDLPDVSDAELASLSPLERGQALFVRNCSTCHTIDGVGGKEGPDLTHAMSELENRLNTRGYISEAEALLESDAQFYIEQRSRIQEVLNAKGEDRVHKWLVNHLIEPRFDNVYAKMPSFDQMLTPEHREDIIVYLMNRK